MNTLYIGGIIVFAVMLTGWLFLRFGSKTQNEGFEQAEKEKDGMMS